MSEAFTVVFDGDVFRPDSPPNLEPNTRYIITIQPANQPVTEGNAWDVLEEMTGTIEAPSDWSVEHDHYLYGTPNQAHTKEWMAIACFLTRCLSKPCWTDATNITIKLKHFYQDYEKPPKYG